MATCGAVALGLALLLGPRLEADKLDSAVQTAAKIHDAAARWRGDNPQGCPTISTLQHEQHLDDGAQTEDPWGNRYRLRCGSDQITVTSAGKDGRAGTGDDVEVPRRSLDG